MNHISFLVRKLFARNGTSQNCYLLLWPDLEGSIYDLKRSTRVPLDSERAKDSYSTCSAALSQLGAKWHGGWQPPPMCILGCGNSMCGWGFNAQIYDIDTRNMPPKGILRSEDDNYLMHLGMLATSYRIRENWNVSEVVGSKTETGVGLEP